MNHEIMTQTDIMLKEIELIQDCIKRMASNSFFLKGWNITVVAACITMVDKHEAPSGYIAAIVACLAFWWMDTYYLRLERMYRRKYEWVLRHRMETFSNAFDLNPVNKAMWPTASSTGTEKEYWKSVNFCAVQWSPTLRNFYIPVLTIPILLLAASTTPLMLKGILGFILAVVLSHSYYHKNDWE